MNTVTHTRPPVRPGWSARSSAPIEFDAGEYWRGCTQHHVIATFRRIVHELSPHPTSSMAQSQFTAFGDFATGCDVVEEETLFGVETLSTLTPIGNALIVSAPRCSSRTVVENLAAALAARNCVELVLFATPDPELQAAIDALQCVLPDDVFRVVSEHDGWGCRGTDTTIVILTPEDTFMNERPWERSGAAKGQSLVDFYSKRNQPAHVQTRRNHHGSFPLAEDLKKEGRS